MAKAEKQKLFDGMNIDTYTPDAAVINRALWGKDTPPDDSDLQKARRELADTIERLREQGRGS